MDSAGDVTVLLGRLSQGDQSAADQVMPLVYDELRRIASRYMRREQGDVVLQTTALVHEAYLRLVEQRETDWESRGHFFAIAAQMMRRILVDQARARIRAKPGNGLIPISLEDGAVLSRERSSNLIELDAALNRLATIDPRQSKIVELRFFGGLTVEETAELMGISPKTVKRDWRVAKAWLHGELRGCDEGIAGEVGGG